MLKNNAQLFEQSFKLLTTSEQQEIHRLLDTCAKQELSLNALWEAMDIVWDELGCDNQILDEEKLSKFYQHPVWILNGLFSEYDEVSRAHRTAICDWIANNSISQVIDFGGGTGALAKIIAQNNQSIQIDVYEPYPQDLSIRECQKFNNIRFIDTVDSTYDCLVSLDVLEHVSDPVKLFSNMIRSVNLGGYLIIANHFFPSIKCHLPSTFHLRYTFGEFAEIMGLKYVGVCEGSHAIIYQKSQCCEIDWPKVRRLERFSKWLFPFREFDANYLYSWKSRLRRLMFQPGQTSVKFAQKFIQALK
jgi:2-polyprenyl-6-hydroxyphenyl methylase/3-demethylubiquinone-9 3-methyltransferase